MRTPRISSLMFLSYVIYKRVLIIFIMLHIASLVLIYLKTGSLCLLTAFIQFPCPLPADSGNQKSDLFLYESVCFDL